MRIKLLLTTAALAASAAGSAQAQGWEVSIGGRAQLTTPYEGAGYATFVPVPTLQIQRPDSPDRPAFPGDSLGVAVLHSDKFSFGPAVRVRGKRDAEDERVGLREVNLAIEPGAFVTIWPTEWLRLHADAGKGVRGHRGWTADAAIDLVMRPGNWTLGVGPRMGWGTDKYMDAYFGVTPAEAAASPVIAAAYAPGGGVRHYGVSVTGAYRLSDSWQVTGNAGYRRLTSEAADSPIIRQIGSRNMYSAGVGLKHTFNWGG